MSVQKPWKGSRPLEVAMYTKRFTIFLSSNTSSTKLHFIDKLDLINAFYDIDPFFSFFKSVFF